MNSGKQSGPSTREMERINWLEFRDWVPARIRTVLLPLGTLEPHGVAPPGSFTVPEEIFRSYVRAVLVGLARNKFKNIILLNGHGGGQTAILSALAQEIGRETCTRLLVVNWWSYCSDVTLEVFGEDGGHGAENESAYIMAIDPALVRKQDYKPEMATAMPPPNTWSAYPFPSTIMLYKEGQGYPTFDRAKAKEYFTKVNDKIARLVQETIDKWDIAGV